MQSHPLTAFKSNRRDKRPVPRALQGIFPKRTSSKAIIDFTRSFAMMVGAHLSLLNALETAARQSENERLKAVLNEVASSIKSGKSLSASLSEHPHMFDALYVNLTQVGEEAGMLDNMLMRLAAHQEKSTDLRRKVRQAMAYPIVVLLVAIGATIFLLTSIVPTFADMFASFGAELPGPTLVILNISNFLTEHWPWLLCAVLILFLLGSITCRQRRVITFWHKWSLRLPICGSLLLHSQTAHFCRMSGTLLHSGIGLVDALSILAESMPNRFIKKELDKVRLNVMQGASLHKPLAHARIFPDMVIQMIAAGEETAELSHMLTHTARYYESEVDVFLGSLSSIIEPIMIVLIGILLGGILIAMYLPMFDLVNVVK